MIDQYQKARDVSVPLIAINTPDQPATTEEIQRDEEIQERPVIRWDLARGAVGLDKAGYGQRILAEVFGQNIETETPNLPDFLNRMVNMRKGVILIMNSHKYMEDPAPVQAICNLRDAFKKSGACLVLLAPGHRLPPEFGSDTLLLDEPLPTQPQIQEIIRQAATDAAIQLDDNTTTKAAEALTGLSSFAAEQATFLALEGNGEDPAARRLDLDLLWERKRQMISATNGLQVWRGGESFQDVGGSDNVKGFLTRVLQGPGAPNAVVFIDEVDKSAGSAASDNDTSGVSQDQLNVLLTWMQDTEATGMLFLGPPGSGKSLVAKAAGNEGGIPTIQLDLGGMKGSLVGESERNIRNALKVINAVAQGRALVLATCNRIANIKPELRRRFRLGTFFFDLPSEEERKIIWQMYLRKYSLDTQELPADMDWTGAEIKQCCDVAWRLSSTLTEAAQFIVPVARSAPQEVKNLRSEATGRFISASYPGPYNQERKDTTPEPLRRRIRGLENQN